MFIFFVFVLSKDSSVTLSLNVLTFVPVAISTRPKTLHGVRRKNAFPTCFNRPDWTTNVDQRAMRRSSQISTTGQYWWFMRDCLLSVQCIIRHTSSTYMHNGWAQLEQAFWKSAAVSHWLALVAPPSVIRGGISQLQCCNPGWWEISVHFPTNRHLLRPLSFSFGIVQSYACANLLLIYANTGTDSKL